MRRLLLPFTFIVLPFLASAQYPEWYMEFQVGYGYDFNTQSPEIAQWVSARFDDDNNYVEQVEHYSYGNGPKAQLGMGVRLSKGLAIDGVLSYSYGLEETITREGFFGRTDQTVGGQHLSFAPMIRVYKDFRYWDDAYVYARVGPTLNMAYSYYELDFDNGASVRKLENDWAFDLGFQAGAGLAIPVARNVHITTELQYVFLISSPSHAEYTRFESGGVDQLPSMNIRQKEIDYRDEITYNQTSDDEPQPMLQVSNPFTHFALNIGCRFAL